MITQEPPAGAVQLSSPPATWLVMSVSVAVNTARQDTLIDGVLAFVFSVGVFGVIWRVGRWVARRVRRAES